MSRSISLQELSEYNEDYFPEDAPIIDALSKTGGSCE